MGLTLRTDRTCRLASVLDLIRLKNNIRSNHAAALLNLIQSKHPELQIWKGRIEQKGRATPIASFETLKQILTLCPDVRAAPTTIPTREHVLTILAKSEAKRPVAKKKHTVSKKKQCCRNEFGPLSSMIKINKIL